MKKLIKLTILFLLLNWCAGRMSGYMVEFPSGRRVLDCAGEIAESAADLISEVRIVRAVCTVPEIR